MCKSQERVLGGKAMSESLECIGSESNMQIPSETRSKPHTLRTKHNSREWRVGELVRSSISERYNVCCLRVGSASCDARPQTNQARAHSNEWRREKEDKEKERLKVSMDTMLPPRHSVGRLPVPGQNGPVRAQLVRADTPGLL